MNSPLIAVFDRQGCSLVSRLLAENLVRAEDNERLIKLVSEALMDSFKEGSKFQLQMLLEVIDESNDIEQSDQKHQLEHR